MAKSQLVPCPDCVKPEEWLPVPGYEEFFLVSSHGRIKALAKIVQRSNGRRFPMKERIRPLYTWPSGHRYTVFQVDGVRDVRSISRLVLEVFVGPCPDGMECLHADDCPDHNHRGNLSWDTRLKNFADRRKTRGWLVPHTKIKAEMVPQIRAEAAAGATQRELAAKYGVTQNTIHHLIVGKTHKDLDGQIKGVRFRSANLSMEKAQMIAEMALHMTYDAVAVKYGISKTTVANIANRRGRYEDLP